MKAKIHVKLNNGEAFEVDHENLERWLEVSVKHSRWSKVKEVVIKPLHEEVNPNADVKQAFPKGRW